MVLLYEFNISKLNKTYYLSLTDSIYATRIVHRVLVHRMRVTCACAEMPSICLTEGRHPQWMKGKS